jgi:hypothetical protein
MMPDAEHFGLQFGFAGGDACPVPGGGFVRRLANVTLECYNGRVSHGTVSETGLCQYRFAIRHSAACPLECPRGANGAICSGHSRGACVKDSVTASPLCRCTGGSSGIACEDLPALPPIQPSAEPSPPPLPLMRASSAISHLQSQRFADRRVAPTPATVFIADTAPNFFATPSFSPIVCASFAALLFVASRSYSRRPISSRSTIAAASACGCIFLVLMVQHAPSVPAPRASSHLLFNPFTAPTSLAQTLPLPSLAARQVPLSDFNRNYQRIFVRNFNIEGGGPHCLASYAWTLSQVLGVRGAHITTRSPVWDARYTANISLVGEGSARGDIVLNHEYHTSQPHPDSGIKQFIIELGDVPLQAIHSKSKYVGHSFYTRTFVRSPATALLRPFVRPDQWPSIPSGPEELRSVKENLVLVDDEGPSGVLGMLQQRLSARWPDIVVVELKGFSKLELALLFRRAKVYVDGGMRGMERAAQEAMLFYVVPVLEFGRNGQNEFDYPLPFSLKYDLSRTLPQISVCCSKNTS